MGCGEAEGAGGRLPVKDGNEAAAHFNRRTLRFFSRVNYYVLPRWYADRIWNMIKKSAGSAGALLDMENLS